ncbi:MAG: Putative ATP:guanido phosphotransferase [Thermoanaerobacterales bacterium 50_218]|nr:MAG: Putative ATP:guanido phosphotransferase [Thermoanaerobacterales bacterium 50_218]HAA90614.1 protein arginine kinase [Peptococcaceae bacterium]
MSIKDALNNAYTKWMEGSGPYASIVISSRVRLARNLVEFPFPHQASEETGRKVIQLVEGVLSDPQVRKRLGVFDFVTMGELSPLERQVLVEKHLISPQHAQENGYNRGLALRDDEAVSIMVNEEDHLRIQVLFPGLQLEAAWEVASQVDDVLEERLDYAFEEKYGYLTCCPTNVGTGLRASVMMHLPALKMTQQLNQVFTTLSKLGMVVRGLYGEGTEAKGNLFQISNQITLGPSEEEIISNLVAVSRQVIEQEKLARESLRKEALVQIEDRVYRSYGILANAYIISSEEAMDHLSNLRLGIDMGILRGIDNRTLNELLVKIRPAFIQKIAGREMDAFNRDLKRAAIIREVLQNYKVW